MNGNNAANRKAITGVNRSYKRVVFREDFQRSILEWERISGQKCDYESHDNGTYWLIADFLLDEKDERIKVLEALISTFINAKESTEDFRKEYIPVRKSARPIDPTELRVVIGPIYEELVPVLNEYVSPGPSTC